MKFFRQALLWPLTVTLGLLVQALDAQRRREELDALAHDSAEVLRQLRQETQLKSRFQGKRPIVFFYRYGRWLYRHQLYEDAPDVWRLALACENASFGERLECYLQLALYLIGADLPEVAETEALQPMERLLGDCSGEWPASDFSAEIARLRHDYATEIRLRLQAFKNQPAIPRELKQNFGRRLELAWVYADLRCPRRALRHSRMACAIAQTPAERVQGLVFQANLLCNLSQFDLAEKITVWHTRKPVTTKGPL